MHEALCNSSQEISSAGVTCGVVLITSSQSRNPSKFPSSAGFRVRERENQGKLTLEQDQRAKNKNSCVWAVLAVIFLSACVFVFAGGTFFDLVVVARLMQLRMF